LNPYFFYLWFFSLILLLKFDDFQFHLSIKLFSIYPLFFWFNFFLLKFIFFKLTLHFIFLCPSIYFFISILSLIFLIIICVVFFFWFYLLAFEDFVVFFNLFSIDLSYPSYSHGLGRDFCNLFFNIFFNNFFVFSFWIILFILYSWTLFYKNYLFLNNIYYIFDVACFFFIQSVLYLFLFFLFFYFNKQNYC
jgi:hypothetical protein